MPPAYPPQQHLASQPAAKLTVPTARTLAAYASEARAFLAFAAKPLRAVTLGDLAHWQHPRGFLR